MELQNVIMLLLLTINLAVAQNTSREEAQELHVGVILDLGSIVGKMARTSVSLAMEDFYAVHRNYSTKLVLHIRDSMSDDVQAASQGTCSQLLGHCISSFCYAATSTIRKQLRIT
uniref:Receptor ligand binding region domain-containing protein n=1 Tax=Aegilops tauschii subsp. strangulata TaxID=200361 RepID=A0A453KW49_AEGTS